MQPRILPLSEDAISQIHSSKQITSLPGVVLALVTNALDADATKVDISVCFSRGSCTVEDNGCGIPSAEFAEHGGLGKMHHTSKAATEHALHGDTGTYLASLAALSLISITSRHAEEDLSATLTLYQGRAIARQYPSSPANELVAFGTHGTRITVDDLFGNMPVRVKHCSAVACLEITLLC
jgi:DNA mismatch repair protein MLH3